MRVDRVDIVADGVLIAVSTIDDVELVNVVCLETKKVLATRDKQRAKSCGGSIGFEWSDAREMLYSFIDSI